METRSIIGFQVKDKTGRQPDVAYVLISDLDGDPELLAKQGLQVVGVAQFSGERTAEALVPIGPVQPLSPIYAPLVVTRLLYPSLAPSSTS